MLVRLYRTGLMQDLTPLQASQAPLTTCVVQTNGLRLSECRRYRLAADRPGQQVVSSCLALPTLNMTSSVKVRGEANGGQAEQFTSSR